MSDDMSVSSNALTPVESAISDATAESALSTMQQSVQLMSSAQFGIAALSFREAAQQFAELHQVDSNPIAAVYAGYCQALANAAEGGDFARSGDRPKAIDRMSTAVNQLKRQVLPTANSVADEAVRRGIRAAIIMDLCGVQTSVYVTEMMSDIVGGNFSVALRTAARIFKDIGDARAEIAGSDLPAELAAQADELLQALALGIKGLEAYAKAEQAAADRRWEEAAAAFDDANLWLKDTKAAWTSLPILASQAQTFQLMLDMMVEPARRRCAHLQDILEEIEQFKEEMVTIARAVGETKVNVDAHQEVTQTVTASIEIKMTIINEFEDRTRTALGDLRAAIAAAPIEETRRKAVLAELDKVTAPAPHDDGFFQRFKQFCANSAEVVGNIAKVAGPVATAWNIFAPFFGMPILPLPVK